MAHGTLPRGPHKLAKYLGLPWVWGGQLGSFCQCPESPGVESMVGLGAASETQEQAWLGPTTGSGQFSLGRGGSVKADYASRICTWTPRFISGAQEHGISLCLPSALCLLLVLVPKEVRGESDLQTSSGFDLFSQLWLHYRQIELYFLTTALHWVVLCPPLPLIFLLFPSSDSMVAQGGQSVEGFWACRLTGSAVSSVMKMRRGLFLTFNRREWGQLMALQGN